MGEHPGASLAPKQKPTRIRYQIVLMLFIASFFSYGDRVMLSITGIAFSKDLHLDALKLGYLFSGFSWAYVVGQLPAGGLLDRLGPAECWHPLLRSFLHRYQSNRTSVRRGPFVTKP